jgi:hypothetical protein
MDGKEKLKRGDSTEHELTHGWQRKFKKGTTPRNMSPRMDSKEKSKGDSVEHEPTYGRQKIEEGRLRGA